MACAGAAVSDLRDIRCSKLKLSGPGISSRRPLCPARPSGTSGCRRNDARSCLRCEGQDSGLDRGTDPGGKMPVS